MAQDIADPDPLSARRRDLARQLGDEFLRHPRRFFDQAPARWDDPLLLGVDFAATPPDPDPRVVFTTSVALTPIGSVVGGLVVITDEAVRAALEANRRDLEARLMHTLGQDPFGPRWIPEAGRIYQPPELLNPFPSGYWASRALQGVYQPPPAVMLPPYDPGPALPTRHRAPAPRFAVGETVLYQDGTVTVERRFRMLWKWRYTIDGPALWLEVDEEELEPYVIPDF